MSAYAALISLQKILVTIIYFPPWISHSRAQLLTLLTEVNSMLNFLDSSSSTCKATQISPLEAKMRDAAYRAEDLLHYGIRDSESRSFYSTMKIYIYTIYAMVVLGSSYLLLFYINPESVPARVQIVLEFVFCVMNAVFLYFCIRDIYVFPPLDDSQELRWLLYHFSIIAEEVNQIKEARGELAEMSANAALISLRQILDSIPDSGENGHLRSLQEKVTTLLNFVGNDSATCTLELEARIRDAVDKAKRALIEFQLPSKLEFNFSTVINISFDDLCLLLPHALLPIIIRITTSCLRTFQPEMTAYELSTVEGSTPSPILRQSCIAFASYLCSAVVALLVLAAQYNSKAPENQELPCVVNDFGFIVRDVTNILDAYGNWNDLPLPSSSGKNPGSTRRDVVVGLDGDLEEINHRLLQGSNERQLASIVGMGGIGKTTLARQVFRDIGNRFDIRAWVTVSQGNSFRHVLLCLLDSVGIPTEEMRQDSEDSLATYLYQHLSYRRYLLVMDDVWDTEIWDSLSRFLPENAKGSRILITSRLPNVASRLASSSSLPHVPLHHMKCLNEDDSWYLLRENAFGDEAFPSELESIGREIARSCRGLPLAIVVIGGLLHKHTEIEAWRDVAEKLKKSQLQDIKSQCWEILALSYNHLPHHLRPCFLYMGFLPREYEIHISRLINLWVAEGFLERHKSKTLEQVAEGYLEDLINRNLISVCKRSCNDKIRTCSIHDLLRDVCVENSRKENFFLVMDDDGNVTRERIDDAPRRLSIHPDALQVDVKHDSVRSVFCIASKNSENLSRVHLGYMYLQVLDVLEVQFAEFPHQITKLVRLRYLALYYDGALPPSISKLKDLETIVHHFSLRKYPLLPRVIWRMRNLRHLYVKTGCYLSESLGYQLLPTSSLLGNLQTLVGIRNFKWSKEIIERIPNLKKLGISYDVPSSVDCWSAHQLNSLADLRQLETLKIIIKYDDAAPAVDDAEPAISFDPPKLAIPQKLKKLSLSGCRIPWERMRVIGELPSLEALKLRCEAFCGPQWSTVEGEFPKLMFLLLEEMSFATWESEESHFPLLQHLIMRSCDVLEEIPSTIGDIPTLRMIKLVDCHSSAEDSANNIQEEQGSMGNEDLKIVIERRRREVDGMDLEKSEGRGAEPGVFQLFRNTIQRGEYNIPVVMVVGLGVLVIALYFLSREVEICGFKLQKILSWELNWSSNL